MCVFLILDQVNYDIWVVDENDNKIYSYAESVGKEKIFNEFGQVGHLLPVEQSGLVRYAIFVHGLGPEDDVNEEFGGYAVIEVPVEDNPLLDKISNNSGNANVDEADMPIPDWIKNNAGWWADGQIDDVAVEPASPHLRKLQPSQDGQHYWRRLLGHPVLPLGCADGVDWLDGRRAFLTSVCAAVNCVCNYGVS